MNQENPYPSLDHYDLREKFSSLEAACLIVGVDPCIENLVEEYGSKLVAQVKAVEEAIFEALERAVRLLEEALDGVVLLQGCPHDVEVAWDRNGVNDSTALPSVELRQALTAMRTAGDFELWDRIAGPYRLALSTGFDFRREDLTCWLMNSNYPARYFLPSLDLNSLTFARETPLLRWVARVQERYLGQNFDINDPDTYPAKKHVIEWLQEQDPTLTETTAAAIDRIAMPFSRERRNKPSG